MVTGKIGVMKIKEGCEENREIIFTLLTYIAFRELVTYQ